MILNPKDCLRYIQGGSPKITSNGIDLSVKAIFSLTGISSLSPEKRVIPGRVETHKVGGEYYLAKDSVYDIELAEYISIPDHAIALIVQRSSLNRMGCFITTGVYDAGFKNQGGCMLHCHYPTVIKPGAHIAQIIFIKADTHKPYDGIYQDPRQINIVDSIDKAKIKT